LVSGEAVSAPHNQKDLVSRGDNSDKDSRAVTKVHPDLVPFDDLPPEEKEKDILELTPPIVTILRNI
jgi:hypothetical protein